MELQIITLNEICQTQKEEYLVSLLIHSSCVCVCVCVFVCVGMCVYVGMCMYVCMYVCVYVHCLSFIYAVWLSGCLTVCVSESRINI